MKAAIVANCHKRNVEGIIRSSEQTLKKCQFSTSVIADETENQSLIQPLNKLPKYDLILTLGGDGTLLRACRTINVHKTPIIGVNLGTLGFITDIRPQAINTTIQNILKKKQCLQKRILINVSVRKGKKILADMTGLNDVVFTSQAPSRILTMMISVDGYPVNKCRGDGLIIATPTGSTGHAMSAGGPIVYPELNNLIIMPICPHTLTNRPLLVSGKRKISVCMVPKLNECAILTVDGQRQIKFDSACHAEIKVSPYYVLLAAKNENSYWDVLKTKLGWRGYI